MSEPLDDLIDKLAAEGGRVRRLAPPMTRALIWLLVVAAVSALAVFAFADLPLFMSRMGDAKLKLELAGIFLTGIAAVVAAFHLSLPDRSSSWALLPLPPLALWIGSSGYSCWRHWIEYGPEGWSLGESADCFRMIVGASVPLGAALLLALSRARPLNPVPVTAVGGLGVAAIGALLLQFFHPFDVTFMDLGVHAVAVGLVVAGSAISGRFIRPPEPQASRG
ncbi:MAG: DUF1109 domain-containing protein [Alphaproteobacteria bacterium]|nr:DUF1109 domain-containing protein [Alphaproteobacteria bacterium]